MCMEQGYESARSFYVASYTQTESPVSVCLPATTGWEAVDK